MACVGMCVCNHMPLTARPDTRKPYQVVHDRTGFFGKSWLKVEQKHFGWEWPKMNVSQEWTDEINWSFACW